MKAITAETRTAILLDEAISRLAYLGRLNWKLRRQNKLLGQIARRALSRNPVKYVDFCEN